MNVLLISQCEKNALAQTRRILDQFAERRGDRTWQTSITKEGLDTLHRLLRQTARKNTAVSCHWIRGVDRSELVWIVGNRQRFNAQGAVPTNTTKRNVLRNQDQNDWHTAEDIQLLAAMAALLHDLGKASKAFQDRLKDCLNGKPTFARNEYRHEWVSLRLFEAFVGPDDDETWLSRLIKEDSKDVSAWTDRLQRDGLATVDPPFATLANAPLAQAIGWLVLTHHRLPVMPNFGDDVVKKLGTKVSSATESDLSNVLRHVQATWNETPKSTNEKEILPFWTFPNGIPVSTEHWHRQSTRVAKRLLALIHRPDRGLQHAWISNPYAMHLARLSLMLADHYYSSLAGTSVERERVPIGYPLYANTARSKLNQTLDEHLIGVAKVSREITYSFPRFEEELPHLKKHRILLQRTQDVPYRWQNKAADLAATIRASSARNGAFIVNMASTGTGKTLANARMMYALADPSRGMRCAFAMGLRTLTLQTGRSFRELLGLGDDELAVRVGGTASRDLFEYYDAEAEATGSESNLALMDEESVVDYSGECTSVHPLLRRAIADPRVKSLLTAPLLVCTIDHLTPATESQRGGRQIAPMLRLLSGDLVLDEPDDFDLDDLPALTRLVYWAGLLGSRVLFSSATLPPSLIYGLFRAYAKGRAYFNNNRGDRPRFGDTSLGICCAWVDEFDSFQVDCIDPNIFEQSHLAFATQRHKRLSNQALVSVRRRAEIVPITSTDDAANGSLYSAIARTILASALDLHERHHSVDPQTRKRVSFGLVRMANIEPLVKVASAMFKQGSEGGTRVHLCIYHSRFPLLVRSAIEHQLDAALRRYDRNAVFELADIRGRLVEAGEVDQLFIVLGSPVTEVGRDHDYDWAIIEPSSMRSLIQAAGRVMRHRDDPCHLPNIRLLSTNIRNVRYPDRAAYCKPGYESDHEEFRLHTHNLQDLLTPSEYEIIDARPRILARPDLAPTMSLVDLEHVRTIKQMLVSEAGPPTANDMRRTRRKEHAKNPRPINAASFWNLPVEDALTTGVLQQQQPFRRKGRREVQLLLRPTHDEGDYDLMMQVDQRKGRRERNLYVQVERSMHHRILDNDAQGPRIQRWGALDYLPALYKLAQDLGLNPGTCASKYGLVTVPESETGWYSSASLGFFTEGIDA